VAQQLDPNLVFVEAKLPGLDGIETTRAIVTERPVPVILIADYAGADLVRRAREAGAVAYLASVDRPRLLSAIAVALERFRELEIIGTEESYSREAPETRRLVDRAKRVLITRLGLSEAEAFQRVLDRTHGNRSAPSRDRMDDHRGGGGPIGPRLRGLRPVDLSGSCTRR